MDDHRLSSLRARAHPLIAIAIAIAAGGVLDALLRATVLRLLFVPLPPASVLVAAAAGVVTVVAENRRTRERLGGVGARLREAILIIIASLAIFMLWGRYPARGIWLPLQPDVLYALALTVAVWLLAGLLHGRLRIREAYLAILAGRETPKAVQDAARTASAESAEADRAVRSVRTIAIVLVSVGSTLMVFAGATSPADLSALTRLVVLQLCVTAVVVIACNGYLWEHDALARDGRADERALRARARFSLATVVIVALVALPTAGRDPIVPPAAIDAFMRTVTDRSVRPDETSFDPTQLFRETRMLDAPARRELLDGPVTMPDAGSGPAVARVVGLVVFAAIGAALLAFLLRPLFAGDGQSGRLSIRSAFRRLREGVARGWRSLLAMLREIGQGTTRAIAETRRAVERVARDAGRRARARGAAARRPAPGRETSRLVRAYGRLTAWGERAGHRYEPWMGPLAYARSVAAAAPERASEIVAVGETFERLAYARTGASADEIVGFEAAVRTATRR